MKLLVSCLLLFGTITKSFIRLHPDSITQPIPIEDYTQSSFEKDGRSHQFTYCDLYIFSLRPVNIISSQHPIVFLSKYFRRFHIKSRCNVIIIFTPVKEVEKYMEIVKKFIFKNFVTIQRVVIFLPPHQLASDFQVMSKKLRKDVVIIEHGATNLTVFSHSLKFCLGDPTCILRHRTITVGYQEIRPYFQVQGWVKGFPEQMPVMNITPENLNDFRGRFSGIEAEMMKYIVEYYKVTFTLIPCEFGKEFPNGTWTGKLGLLADTKLNMVMGSLPGNYRRGRIGTHSAQIFTIYFTLTSMKPDQMSSYQALLRPFPWTAWLTLLASIGVVGPVTWWVTKWNALLTRQSLGKKQDSIGKTCGNAALTLLVEPWKNPPRGPAIFILSGWFLAALALQCLYSSNLIASLSIPEIGEPVKTFEDANEQGKTVLIKSGTTPELLLQKHGTRAGFRLVHNKDEYYGTDILKNKTYIATYDLNTFRFRVLSSGQKLKHFYTSPEPFLIIFSGWLYSKEFKLVEAIDTAILRASDAGLTGKWFQDQFLNGSGKNRIIKSKRDETAELALELKEKPLTMFQLQILFTFWIIGASISVVAFAVEIFLHRKYNTAQPQAKPSRQEHPWDYLE